MESYFVKLDLQKVYWFNRDEELFLCFHADYCT